MKRLIVLSCLVAVMPVIAQIEAGHILDKKLYVEGREFKVDTIRIDELAKSIGLNMTPDGKSIESLGRALAVAGNTVYRLKELQPMAAVILTELGYQVVLLSQLYLLPEGYIKLNVSGESDYESRRYYTHRYYEMLGTYNVKPPAGHRDDYEITMRFPGEECEVYKGKDDLLKGTVNCISPEGTRRLDFANNATLHVNIKKTVLAAYVVVKGIKKPAEIVKEVTKSMDKYKLDLSYKVPRLEKCASENEKMQ